MIRTPPQHNVMNPPGCINYERDLYTEKIDQMAFKSHPKTLGDVIDNAVLHEEQLQKKKLTFEEWFYLYPNYPREGMYSKDDLAFVWKTAQENK